MASLKERLQNYLRNVWFRNPNVWIPKGTLEDLTKQAGYLGDNYRCILKELCEDGKIERRRAGISIEYKFLPTIEEISNNIDKLI